MNFITSVGIDADPEHVWNTLIDVELGTAQTGPLAWLVGILYGRLTRRYIGMEAQGLKRSCESAE